MSSFIYFAFSETAYIREKTSENSLPKDERHIHRLEKLTFFEETAAKKM